MGQKFEKNLNFWPFLAFTSPISQWPLKNTLTSSLCSILIGTCEASRFYSNSNRTSRFDSVRKWRADSKISNRRACHVCRRTINNTHCSTTNFNRFGIATGIYSMHNSSLVAIAQYLWRIRTSVLYGNQKKINVNDYPPIRFEIRFERKFPIVGL